MHPDIKLISDLLQQSDDLAPDKKEAILKALANAEKHWTIADFKTEMLEKVKRTTGVLLDETIEELENKRKLVEAQNRELEIEAALQSVWTRTMAMRQSPELQVVIMELTTQLQHLGFNIHTANFNINLDVHHNQAMELWVAAPGQNNYPSKLHIPYFDHPMFTRSYHGLDSGENFIADTLTFEEKNSFYEFVYENTILKNIPEARKKYVLESKGLARSIAITRDTALTILNYDGIPYTDEQNAILKRMAFVFEQAYSRFLDLEKAEAQTREAIKQASIDRIRAEIASMRTSDDLQRITPSIWKELTSIGLPFLRCGIFIMDEVEKITHSYLSTPDGRPLAALHLGFESSELTRNVVTHWRAQRQYSNQWNRQQFTEWVHSLIEQGHIAEADRYQAGEMPPEFLVLQFVPFVQGMLYVGSAEHLSDMDIELVSALAEAFSAAYARYEDFRRLEEAKTQVEITLTDLKAAQAQLIQSEKMASLGELTAGIAHEIQNPLNFVNNFSEVSHELLDEMKEELSKNNSANALQLAVDVKHNLEKILHHGKRADSIVKGMLQHSRTGGLQMELTDINLLADEYTRLAYHGMKAKDKSFKAKLLTEFDPSVRKIKVVPQEIGRMILNLINNAFYAVNEKRRNLNSEKFEPTITVSTRNSGDKIEIIVGDNGNGIPQKVQDKIFQPFFTTKPTGQGTGLGLSLSYDIVKAHGGELIVATEEGVGTSFTIQLPT